MLRHLRSIDNAGQQEIYLFIGACINCGELAIAKEVRLRRDAASSLTQFYAAAVSAAVHPLLACASRGPRVWCSGHLPPRLVVPALHG